MNDIDIEEYNNNIIQELNAAEEEGECSLSIFLHDLIEIDIESNFTFNYNVIYRIIDICINSLHNNLSLLAHDCMYFVRYCINKSINIKEDINENFFKNLNIIIDICLKEGKFYDDSFLLFERTFFFFVLDLYHITNLIDIWKKYNDQLILFCKSLLHIISFHLSLINEILNSLKIKDIDINYIQKGYSRIKIIEIASDLLLNIFKSNVEIQNITNIENYINIIIKEYVNVPDIEIKKKIDSLLKSIYKLAIEKKIENFSFWDKINNLVNKKKNYYLALTKEKDINIDYLKGNSYIYINNSNLNVKTFNDNEQESGTSDKVLLTQNGYRGCLLMNIFYAYFYDKKNRLLMVLSYDRIKINNEENSKIVSFHFKRADAIGVLSNTLRANFEDRFLDNVEISICFNSELITKNVYRIINCVIEAENISSDDCVKEKDEGEVFNLKEGIYINRLKTNINNDSNNNLIKTNNKVIEKLERRKVSFATTKEICLLNDNTSVETKTILLEESLNNIGCNNSSVIDNQEIFGFTHVENNAITDTLFNISTEINEDADANEDTEADARTGAEKKNKGNLKISYATTRDLIKEDYMYDNISRSSNQMYENSLIESSRMNTHDLNSSYNESVCAFNNELSLNNQNYQENLPQMNFFEEKNNQQGTKLNASNQAQHNQNIENNDKIPGKMFLRNTNVEMDIDVVEKSTNEKETYQSVHGKYEKRNINCCEADENENVNIKENIQANGKNYNEKSNDSRDDYDYDNDNHDNSGGYDLRNMEVSRNIPPINNGSNFKIERNKSNNETKKTLNNLVTENSKKNALENSNVNDFKIGDEYATSIFNNSQIIYSNMNASIPKSPVDIVKKLLNYDEKQKNIDECIHSLKKYDSNSKMKATSDTQINKIQAINGVDKIYKEENSGNLSISWKKNELDYEKINSIEEQKEPTSCSKLITQNSSTNEKELLRNEYPEKGNKTEVVQKYVDNSNNDISLTNECSEIVNILVNDQSSNEIALNNEIVMNNGIDVNIEKEKQSDLTGSIDKSCLSSKSKKRISTNMYNDVNDDHYLKNSIDSPYPIKKAKFNNYDSSFLDLLKREDNLENLSAKYLIKAYTLIQYNKRYINIQIIDYFRYIRKEILLSYEKINIKYTNLLKELQSEYEMKFQSIMSKYSSRLTTTKNINMNVPKSIDLNLIQEKLDSLNDTYHVVQRTIKDKISNSKILMKYKQSDIYTPTFSLATIISKYST